MAIASPVPRKVELDESGGKFVDVIRNLEAAPIIKKKEEKPAKARQPKPQPKQLPVETLFNFAAPPRETRRRFNQDTEFPDPDSKDYKPTTPSNNNNNNNNEPVSDQNNYPKGGRRGGRGTRGGGGGQGRGGGRGRRFNNSSGYNNRGNGGNGGNAGNGGNVLPSQPEDWPELVFQH